MGRRGQEGSQPEPLRPRGGPGCSCNSFTQEPSRRHTMKGFKYTKTSLVLRRSSPGVQETPLYEDTVSSDSNPLMSE